MSIRKLFAFGVFAIVTATPVMADPYSPTLAGRERARHEFRDVQREAYPRGPAPQRTAPAQRNVVPAPLKRLLGSPAQGKSYM
ncbi:MAG: hypothetical protein ABII76_21415 [Pseudomonadota bacterium]